MGEMQNASSKVRLSQDTTRAEEDMKRKVWGRGRKYTFLGWKYAPLWQGNFTS